MTSSQKISFDWRLASALTVAILAWSSAWVGVRAAVKWYPPGELALGRYLVASLVLLPIFRLRRSQLPRLQEWPGIFLMGLLGFTCYNLAINWGEKTVTAGAAAFISTTIPIFTTLGARVFLGEKTASGVWAGFGLSVLGVAAIASGEKGGLGFSPGAGLILVAAMCAAGYGLLQKGFLKRYNALDTTTWAIWAGTLCLVPFGFGLGSTVREVPIAATWTVVFLGIFPGALGYVLWSYALQKMPVARLMSFLYLVPPISVVMAWGTLGEIPNLLSLIGGSFALAGVVLSNAVSRNLK